MFTVSTIYSAKDFLALVKNNELSTKDFLKAFERYKYESSKKVLQLVTECGWVHLDGDGNVFLSERGHTLAELEYKDALVKQLEDMILNYNPVWGSFLPKGREEAIRFLPDGPKQCFKEAGFLGHFTDDLIDTWDKLALAYRNYSNQQRLETGRKGERLTMKYEEERTGNRPRWQALESNLSGYDILSRVDKNNDSPLLIEVKSTTSTVEAANLFITRNEWKVANSSNNYLMHLWILEPNPKQIIVPKIEIEQHIPENSGDGSWESVKIPYKAFV